MYFLDLFSFQFLFSSICILKPNVAINVISTIDNNDNVQSHVFVIFILIYIFIFILFCICICTCQCHQQYLLLVQPHVFVNIPDKSSGFRPSPRIYFGTKRVSVIDNPAGKFFDTKIRCWMLMTREIHNFCIKSLTRYFYKNLPVIDNPEGIFLDMKIRFWMHGTRDNHNFCTTLVTQYFFWCWMLVTSRESQGFCTNWCWRGIFFHLPDDIQLKMLPEKNILLSDISNSFPANWIAVQKCR